MVSRLVALWLAPRCDTISIWLEGKAAFGSCRFMQQITLICRMLNTVFLLCMLVVLALILHRVPIFPTQSEISQVEKVKNSKVREDFFGKIPTIGVYGSVSVDGPVSVENVVTVDGSVRIER